MMSPSQALLFEPPRRFTVPADIELLKDELDRFSDFGKRTVNSSIMIAGWGEVPVFINEFWTAKQRAASSLHEVSYRACFKPQLPRFFISRLTQLGDIVYDPFMGRGTTLIEAALEGRTPYGCDINPLSTILAHSRLTPPNLSEVSTRLGEIDFSTIDEWPDDLLTFYHPETLKEICALKRYFILKKKSQKLDRVDLWLWMVATNRLTGHSPGFFSVYTLPPNQAVSVKSQRKINQKRGQVPLRRNVSELIFRKSKQLLADVDDRTRDVLSDATRHCLLITGSSDKTPQIQSDSVALAVTSPPFLDVVDYAQDNWLRAWFCGIDISNVSIWRLRSLDQWESSMTEVLREVCRVLIPGGSVAFEVGEVRNGKIKLEESVVRVGLAAGLTPVFVLINDQVFTKTANCWGVENSKKGTNTNRVVVFQK
jgi:hypothetical protein